MSVAPRSPLLRLLRAAAFLWFAFSALGVAAAFALLVYAAGWGCSAPPNGMGRGLCVVAYGMAVPAALASLFMSTVMLLFAHLFYRGGVRIHQPASPKPTFFSRKHLFEAILDIID